MGLNVVLFQKQQLVNLVVVEGNFVLEVVQSRSKA
jgi:hypothetical protein